MPSGPEYVEVAEMGISALRDLSATRQSSARNYCRRWPVVTGRASTSWLPDEEGHARPGFSRGAGAPDYARNNPAPEGAATTNLSARRAGPDEQPGAPLTKRRPW
jgi:hypothetical protein